MLNEADIRREFVVPKLCAVGGDTETHRISEQVTLHFPFASSEQEGVHRGLPEVGRSCRLTVA